MENGTFQGFSLEVRDPGIVLITFNRPEVLNASTQWMKRDLVETLAQVQMDDSARVVVFTGTGRGFMAGDDFELRGGFWFELPPTDCNDDGLVSLVDYETFTACLAGPGGGLGADPCPCFDADRDGDITLHDYALSQAEFVGQ